MLLLFLLVLMLLLLFLCLLFTFIFEMSLVATNLCWAIPVVCRPHVHLCCPRSHHKPCPRYCWSKFPTVPPVLCDLPPALHQYCCRLDWKMNTLQHFLVITIINENLTGFSTVHLISATNTVLYAITQTSFWDATWKCIYPSKWTGTLPIFTVCVQKTCFVNYHREPSLRYLVTNCKPFYRNTMCPHQYILKLRFCSPDHLFSWEGGV